MTVKLILQSSGLFWPEMKIINYSPRLTIFQFYDVVELEYVINRCRYTIGDCGFRSTDWFNYVLIIIIISN